MDNNPTGSLPQDNNVMTRRMKSCPYLPLLVLLTTTCSTATTSSSCSFSDILSNNTACLPTLLAEGSFVALPPLELQLQFNDGNNTNADNDVDASVDGIRFALEYYLNYSLSRFDDVDAGFDDGGFAYAKVDNVAPASSSSSEPVRRLRRQTTTRSLLSLSSSWRLSVSAGAFYNLSPGGWIFSSIPTSMELLQRVQSVVEEPLEDADDNVVVGGKFAAVLKMLLFDREGLQAFRNVMGVKVVLEEEEETGRPSLRPTWISLESTLAPTIGVLTTESSSTNEPASDSPTISSTAIMTTNGPTVSRIESSPAPSKEPTVLVTPIPTQIGIQSINPSTQWPTVVMIKTLPPTRTNSNASPTAVMIKTLPPTRTNNDASIGDSVVSSSPSPTVAHRNGDGGSTPHSMTPSNTFETDQNRSDAPFGLAVGTNIDSTDDDTLGIQTNGNSTDDNSISNNSNNDSQTEGNINKELLSSTSSDNNKSKIIASSTLAVSFLILVLVSGAFVIQRRGRNRKELKGDKSYPLHFLADDGLKGDEEAEEKSLSGEYLDGDHFRHELNGNATSKQHVSSSSEADFTVAAAAATTAVLISEEEKNANNETCPTPVTPRKSKSESNLPREMNQQNLSSDRPVRNRVRIIPSGAASSPNDSSIQNRHRSIQSTYRYSPNNAVDLSNEKSDSTPSNKNDDSVLSTPGLNGYDPSYVIAHYDEERIAKKEMARELFLTKEQMKRVGRRNGSDTNLDFTMNDLASTERLLQLNSSSDVMSEDTPSLGVCYQANNEVANIQSSPSLEYSASDAMSNDTSHRQTNQRLSHTTFNIISPSSLPSRRKHVKPQHHGTDPPDHACCRDPPDLDLNNVTVVTDDDSVNGNDDHHDRFFPSCKEVSSHAGIAKINKGWNKCLDNCAPTSFKDLVSPIRHDEDDCEENNNIVRGGEKWFNHAMCGRECGDNNLRRVSPSFSNGQSDYENDWDFGDVEDEGDVKSGEDAFSLGSVLT